MLSVLKQLKQRVIQNKVNDENNCNHCPLHENYAGPLIIDHEGCDKPEIIIISESPGGFESYEITEVDKWKKEVLSKIKLHNPLKSLQFNTLGEYLARLTENRIVRDPNSLSTINKIYWTHAMKCFIQKQNDSIRKAKLDLGDSFRDACNHCSHYLIEEIEYVKPQLTIIIGGVAYNAIFPKMKDIVGKSLSFSGREYIFTYHPNAQLSNEVKMRGFEYAKKRIDALL